VIKVPCVFLNKIKKTLSPSTRTWLRHYYNNFTKTFKSISTHREIIFKKIYLKIKPMDISGRKGSVFVNLGCGLTNHPRFINIDGYPHPHIHYVSRIDRLSMFAHNSVDLIYASHCLEHFKYGEVDRVLDEWHRVIKPGGIIRLSVPDIDKLIDIYNDTNDPDDIVPQLMGGQNNKYNYHYVVFNGLNLKKYLNRAGFVGVQEWIPGSCDLTTFDDFSVYHKVVNGKNYPISLNLEAKKV